MNQSRQGHHKLNSSDSNRKCGVILGQPDDWNKAFANELEAAFAKALVPIAGRGTGSGIPNGQIDLIVGFNDGKSRR